MRMTGRDLKAFTELVPALKHEHGEEDSSRLAQERGVRLRRPSPAPIAGLSPRHRGLPAPGAARGDFSFAGLFGFPSTIPIHARPARSAARGSRGAAGAGDPGRAHPGALPHPGRAGPAREEPPGGTRGGRSGAGRGCPRAGRVRGVPEGFWGVWRGLSAHREWKRGGEAGGAPRGRPAPARPARGERRGTGGSGPGVPQGTAGRGRGALRGERGP